MIPKPDVAVTPEIPGIATEVGVVKDTRAKTGIPDVISAEIDILAMTTVTPDIPVETGNKLEIPAGPPPPPRRDSSYEGCYYCKGTDHRLRNCKKVTCITCGKKGHTAIDCKSENSQKIREVVDDGPRSLRSRSPSPYPGRGREATPTQYVNRISLNKKTIGFTKDA